VRPYDGLRTCDCAFQIEVPRIKIPRIEVPSVVQSAPAGDGLPSSPSIEKGVRTPGLEASGRRALRC